MPLGCLRCETDEANSHEYDEIAAQASVEDGASTERGHCEPEDHDIGHGNERDHASLLEEVHRVSHEGGATRSLDQPCTTKIVKVPLII